ncbi:MAG TPA: type II toxin-antitoxin system prevent-host-death family antitoxin [Acidobacteriaceae bacterium]|nr:type II toxin-antitoxin system prevent-host-death family antitoxin [Acidobacteriaceae bacterium]
MREVGAFAAKNALGALLDEVERGGEIVITRHGRAVARLVPVSGGIDRPLALEAVERIRRRAEQLPAAAFRWEEVKADRDRGRR